MKFVTLFMSTFLCLQAYCQESMKPIGFVLQPSLGISIPLSSIQNGSITDNLISAKETPSFYFQLSATYFWKHWGLGGSVTLDNSNDPQQFVEDVRKYYSDQYYVNMYDYNDSHSLATPVVKLLAGPSYKIEKGNFLFISKLLIGVNQFQARANEAYLKEKNTNTIVTLDWYYDRRDYGLDFFCVSPSVSIAYRFSNRIALSFDIMLMQSVGSFEYYQISKDVDTHNVSTKTFRYNNALTELNLGGSLVYLLHRNNKIVKDSKK